jgi:hypothetical protein
LFLLENSAAKPYSPHRYRPGEGPTAAQQLKPGDHILVEVEVAAVWEDPDFGVVVRTRSREPWGSWAYRSIRPDQALSTPRNAR